MTRRTAAVLAFLLVSTAAVADIKFTRLSENRFIVSHRKQQSMLGAEAKAMKTLYSEVASICIAAGYSHFELVTQDVQERSRGGPWGGGRGASGTVDVKMRNEAGEDHIECAPLADPKKVGVAKKKLANGELEYPRTIPGKRQKANDVSESPAVRDSLRRTCR